MSRKVPRSRKSRAAPWIVGLMFALFALITGAATVIMLRRNVVVEQFATYNVSFIATQTAAEMQRLQISTLNYMVSGQRDDAERVQLQFDIVANRLDVLSQGDAPRVLSDRPAFPPLLHRLTAFVSDSQLLVDAIETPPNAWRLAETLAGFEEDLGVLVSIGKMVGGEQNTEVQGQLDRLQNGAIALFAFLSMCGVVLTGLLWWAQRSNALLAQRERDLDVQNGRFEAALNNMSQALCMADDQGRLIVCNQRFKEMFGIDGALSQAGTPLSAILRRSYRKGCCAPSLLSRIRRAQADLMARRGSGSFFQEVLGSQAISVTHESLAEGGWVATYEDISEKRRIEARFAHMAMHDALTDLPNRFLLRERLDEAFTLQQRGVLFTVFCLDLDYFKDVNDSLGHLMGDTLLKQVAARLLACVDEGDLVVRLGGDEFAILHFRSEDPSEAANLATHIIDAVCAPYLLNGHRVNIGTSVGIAMAPRDGTDGDSLMKNADMALYKAKEEGRGTFCFFETQMGDQMQMQRTIEIELLEAIEKRGLEVFYQPQLNLADNAIRGCEALLRWRHPRLGFVSPAQFIPVAEKIGLIGRLGEWVLHEACRAAAAWPKQVRVAVNLSPAQFKTSDVVRVVADALAASGLPAQRLELEITESVLLQSSDQIIGALHALRAMGVRISLDDFGTGHSSPSYLLQFPFDKVKIDRCFVSAEGMDTRAISIVRSITRLATELGMTTTAEGVETSEQLERMREALCTEVQGYLLSRPLPLCDIRRFLGIEDLKAS